MAKRYANLWPGITSFENLHHAFRKAARGRRSRASVAGFEMRLEENLLRLRRELRSGAYRPGPYTSFLIHDPKRRLISAAPFRDRVVHHALVNSLEPIYERKFIHDTYANRVGKGSHKALDRCTYFLRRWKYVLPLDVRQFFASVDHAILAMILAKTIADERALALCRRILAGGQGVLDGEYEMVHFPGDDLFARFRPRGLPIGNLTSQFWANVYLNDLDQAVKRELKCRAYIRYVDDLLLFADDKPTLHGWCRELIERFEKLRLTVHTQSAQARPTRSGVPFLGFQVYPDHRRLKRPKVVQARRRLKALVEEYRCGRVSSERLHAGVVGWVAHAQHGDTWGLRRSLLGQLAIPPREVGV